MLKNSKKIDANNNLNSKLLFEKRNLYKEEILPEKYYSYYADLWYSNYFYGKINSKNHFVFPSELFLKELPAEPTKNAQAIDFVADAFIDLRKYYLNLLNSSKISQKSPYRDMLAQRAITSIHESYDIYIKTLVQTYISNNFPAAKKKNIFGFSSFLKDFIENVGDIAANNPINRSTFVGSIYNNVLTTGLVIEIESGNNHADDLGKVNRFINDANFEVFLDAAKRYGFMVDKNAPWRIIADLQSPAMLTYMQKYGINSKEDVFKTRYYVAYYTDIKVLKIFVKQLYNTYIALNPITYVDKLSICDKTIIETFENKQINENQFEEICDQYFMNKLYIYIKAKESLKKWDQNTFNKIVYNANEILKYGGEEASVDYIASQFDIRELLSQKNTLTDESPDVILKIKEEFKEPAGFKF